MSEIIEFEFEGMTFEADAAACRSYKVIKGISMAGTDMPGFFRAAEAVFCGKDVEYADMLGDIEKFGELVAAAVEAAGAKNS